MKRGASLLFVIIFLFTGCSIQRLPGMELSDRLIVEAIGIDALPAGVILTLETIDPAPQKTDGEESKNRICYRFTADSVAAAAYLAEQQTGKVPFFAYAGILLFGTSAAEKGLAPYLDFFLRNRTIRNTVPVCLANGSAADVLNEAFTSAESPAKAIERSLRIGAETGQSAKAPFFQFVNRMLSPDTEAYCPIIRTVASEDQTGPAITCTETAVFSGDCFRFRLTENETAAFLLLNHSAKESLVTAHAGQADFNCRLQRIETTSHKEKNTQGAQIRLSIRARGTIVETGGFASFPAAKTDRTLAREALQRSVCADAERCLHTIYQLHKTDLLRIRKKHGIAADVPPDTLDLLFEVILDME